MKQVLFYLFAHFIHVQNDSNLCIGTGGRSGSICEHAYCQEK